MVVRDVIDIIRQVLSQEVKLHNEADQGEQFAFEGTVSDFKDSNLFTRIADAIVVDLIGNPGGAITICYDLSEPPEIIEIEDLAPIYDWITVKAPDVIVTFNK